MVILAGLVAAAAILFVAGPLLGWGGRPAFEDVPTGREPEREALLHRRQEVLHSIKDLDMEYALGKLTREDHQHIRDTLTAEALTLYRRLDDDPKG